MRRCLDCNSCHSDLAALTGWKCVDDRAIEKRQTRIPGIYDCEFWVSAPWPNPEVAGYLPGLTAMEPRNPQQVQCKPCEHCRENGPQNWWCVSPDRDTPDLSFGNCEHWSHINRRLADCSGTVVWGKRTLTIDKSIILRPHRRAFIDYLTGAVCCRDCGVRLRHVERIMTRRSRRHIQAIGLARCPDGCPTAKIPAR